MPQRAMPGMRTVQVAAEMPKTAHTWRWHRSHTRLGCMLAAQVAANSPKTAHTWQRRTSAMSPVRYCGGGPHRAVQNQAFCRTGRPRRTVRYRKRPCGVREVHLSTGAARGGGSSAGATESWAIGGWWLRDWAAGGREVSDNERNNDLSCLVLLTGKVLFCLIVSVLSATAGGAAPARTVSRPEKCLPSREIAISAAMCREQ